MNIVRFSSQDILNFFQKSENLFLSLSENSSYVRYFSLLSKKEFFEQDHHPEEYDGVINKSF